MTEDNRESSAARELTRAMHGLIREVRELAREMKSLKEEKLPELLVTHTLHGEKISRLEWVVYGIAAAMFTEGLAIVAMVVAWLVTR